MVKICFEDIKFTDGDSSVVVTFLRMFTSAIDKSLLSKVGKSKVVDGCLEFTGVSDKELSNKFNPLLSRSFDSMKSILTGHDVIYVHRNSGIPLIGSIYFGIVDRGTNIIEVKPITGCNIDCAFCSVDEGASSRKMVDFVVEADYLVDEVKRVIAFKQKKVDVFINTHGEPLLYSPIVYLVREIRAIDEVNVISIITNGTLLTKSLADELVAAGLNQINISINAFDDDIAKELAGTSGYNIRHILEIARHISKKIKTVIAPVWIKSKNDDQIPKLIAFAKEIGADIGIQNYMVHRLGRKVSKQVEWEDFYAQLDEWEKQSGRSLKTTAHTAYETKPLEKPFRKGDVVKADILCRGRMKKEMIAAAKGRVISIIECTKEKGTVKLRIHKDKDNIFVAEEA